MRKDRVPDLISEIKDELTVIESLISDIEETAREIPQAKKKKRCTKKVLRSNCITFIQDVREYFRKLQTTSMAPSLAHSIGIRGC